SIARQAQGKRAARRVACRQAQLATEGTGDEQTETESEPQSVDAAFFAFSAKVRFEQMRLLVHRDAGTRIRHMDQHMVRIGSQRDPDFAPVRHLVTGVVEQIDEYLLNPF